MRIFIEPTEPLMFRTGKPFSAGENNFAETLFPPTPETLQGALRAAIAAQWGKLKGISDLNKVFREPDVVSLIGDRNTYGRFRITGLTLGRRNQETMKVMQLFPTPANVLRLSLVNKSNKEETRQQLVYLRPEWHPAWSTNVPAGCKQREEEMALLFPAIPADMESSEKAEPLKGWLTPHGLQSLLSGEQIYDYCAEKDAEEQDVIPENKIYTREPRLGIGMSNDAKATKEGYLYQVEMIRMQPGYGFVIDVTFVEKQMKQQEEGRVQESTRVALTTLEEIIGQGGWMTLGGEQRAAHFVAVAPADMLADVIKRPDTQSAKKNILLYFATPAFFKNGWLPENMQMFPDTPITAAVNRYQSIGGWSLEPGSAGGSPKVTHRCVPAGSVYFFEDIENFMENQLITEHGAEIGYGITYTGEWK